MTPEQFMTDRVDDQIEYHEARSKSNQTWFKRLRFIEIVAAATIPFLIGYADNSTTIQVIVGLLGVLIAVITGTMALYSFEQNWTTSRATIETLKHEKILYETNAEPYNVGNPFPIFVDKVETMLVSEQSQWVARMQARQQPANQQGAVAGQAAAPDAG